MVKTKLTLKNSGILLVEAFLVYNSKTKIFPDMLRLQNDGPQQYLKKPFSEKSNNKSFGKNEKVHWATVPTVQETKNAAKKSGFHFCSLKTANLEIDVLCSCGIQG